jgi:hypothetical protein
MAAIVKTTCIGLAFYLRECDIQTTPVIPKAYFPDPEDPTMAIVRPFER